jgi:hypothetical protein
LVEHGLVHGVDSTSILWEEMGKMDLKLTVNLDKAKQR